MAPDASADDRQRPRSGTGSTTFSVECPFATSLYHTIASHGWANLAPWQWDTDSRVLCRPERLQTGRTVLVKVSQPGPQNLTVVVEGSADARSERDEVVPIVSRWFSLDWDPSPAIDTAAGLDGAIAGFIGDGGGRFLRCSSFYEDFAKTVCTVNANWGATRRMVSGLVDVIGMGLFPTPVEVVQRGEQFLREKLRTGFRASVLIECTQQMLDQGVMNERGQVTGPGITYDYLLGLRGVGPYSAGHVAMLLGDFGHVPVDSEVTSYCRQRYGLEPDDVDSFFESWGQYRFLGYKLGRILSGSD